MTDRLRIEALFRPNLGPFTLSVAPGECVVITGRSGAGKSLLLRMIADLDVHTGEAWVDGVARAAMSAPEWRRQVAYCAAESAWWHTAVGTHFASPPPTQIVERLGLNSTIFSQETRLCSTGERQRLSLLRTLSLGSRVLLLDEPTGPLDPDSVARVELLLRERLQAGTAIILITHDPTQASRMFARHLNLEDGQLKPA